MRITLIALLVILSGASCKTQKETVAAETSIDTSQERTVRGQRGERRQPPTLDELFQMDTNNDGKLSKDELKGPLARDFDTIDTDKDGFLSRKEVEKAPKPPRGKRQNR